MILGAKNMKKALDIAYYIIKLAIETGECITNMKLQKLLYYSYAWFLVDTKNKRALFGDKIYAWQYGPVVESVYQEYKQCGADNISLTEDDLNEKLDQNSYSEQEEEVIKQVFMVYGGRTAIELVSSTHSETPWITAYGDGTKRNSEITRESIYKYFSAKKDAAIAQGV